jgi:hypothetical protein
LREWGDANTNVKTCGVERGFRVIRDRIFMDGLPRAAIRTWIGTIYPSRRRARSQRRSPTTQN